MRRKLIIGLIVAAVAVAGIAVVAWPRTVKVRTGTRVVCTYGELLSEDIKTIEVPAKDASKYQVSTETITCARHKQAQKLYQDAQKALADGDVDKAKKALTKLVAIDPKFAGGAGVTQLAEIQDGKKPKARTGDADKKPTSGSGGGNGQTGGNTQPPAALIDYVPDSLSGYKADKLSSDGVHVTRVYLPSGSSDKRTGGSRSPAAALPGENA